MNPVFLLDIPSAKNKIIFAYSPSLGSKGIPEDQIEYFRQATKDFYAISTREEQGAKYCSVLLNWDVDWALDPTLLLLQEK